MPSETDVERREQRFDVRSWLALARTQAVEPGQCSLTHQPVGCADITASPRERLLQLDGLLGRQAVIRKVLAETAPLARQVRLAT